MSTTIDNTTASKNSKPVHSGHRERLKKRFLVNNGKDFTDHELLELLLFFVLPRVNTNELAHRLLDEFGTLEGVFNADIALLEKVDGAGKTTSLFINLYNTISKRIEMEKHKDTRFLGDSLTKVGNFLCDYYRGVKVEEFCVMLLDNSFRLIDFSTMSTGSVNSASVDTRAVAKHALNRDASYVILSHNHPSGTLHQSTEDRLISVQIESALNAIGISLLEHIIVNEESYAPTMMLRVRKGNALSNVSAYRNFYNS